MVLKKGKFCAYVNRKKIIFLNFKRDKELLNQNYSFIGFIRSNNRKKTKKTYMPNLKTLKVSI